MSTTLTRTVPPQPMVDLVNPLVRGVLRSPLHGALDSALLILHVTGRRSGRRFDIPVGYIELDGAHLVVTQHTWRANLRGGAEVEVTIRGARVAMHAEVDEDPVSVAAAFDRVVERFGWRAAGRMLGLTDHAGRRPTPAELEAAVREFDLALVTLTPPR
ncbi:nitroreductase/quinone reductase family protein [Pseudonocardia xishanensis]|uniref:Deazaflavin-dependent oxidoreductase (Nitroreductase family) n=1 Tax=Pseudonocardia xishanensis TaxID=630995 RepID=A0ABP8RVI2_9PSEU